MARWSGPSWTEEGVLKCGPSQGQRGKVGPQHWTFQCQFPRPAWSSALLMESWSPPPPHQWQWAEASGVIPRPFFPI